MTIAQPPPPPAVAVPGISVRGTVNEAVRLVWRQPRRVVLPLMAVEIPVAVILAIIASVLFLTAFKDEPFVLFSDINGDVAPGLVFMLIALAAVTSLFGQVSRAATVVAVAGVARGKPKSLSESLDPAFTRMGGLLVQAVLLAGMLVVLVISLVGIIVVPFILARLGVATEVMVLEEKKPLEAFSRSWRMTQGSVLKFLAGIVLTALVVLGPAVMASFLQLAVTGSRTQQVILFGVTSVAQAILLAPALALVTTFTTLFYLKLKAREDGRSTL